jgi:hypothetical protein
VFVHCLCCLSAIFSRVPGSHLLIRALGSQVRPQGPPRVPPNKIIRFPIRSPIRSYVRMALGLIGAHAHSASTGNSAPDLSSSWTSCGGGGGCGRSGQAVPHPQSRSSEGSVASAAAAAGGDDSPKGTSGCAPPPPSLRTTGVGRRGGEARRARRTPQRSPARQGRGLTATSMRTAALLSTAWGRSASN